MYFPLNVLSSQCSPLSMSSPLNVFFTQWIPLSIFSLLNVFPSQYLPLLISFLSISSLLNFFLFQCHLLSIFSLLNVLLFQCLPLLMSSPLNAFPSQYLPLITCMYRSTPIDPLISESGLMPLEIMLNHCPRKYAYRLLSLPDGHPTKDILPITLRTGDGSTQPGEQPDSDAVWSSNQKIKSYRQHLAQKVSIGSCRGNRANNKLAAYRFPWWSYHFWTKNRIYGGLKGQIRLSIMGRRI